MPRRTNNTSGEYRALLASFDNVFSASIAEKCVNLSDQEILAILSQSEYLKWRTRWYKGDYSQDFDQTEIDTITALAASIQDKLVNGLDDCIECQAGDCIEYAPNASFIDWSPSTPGDVNDIPSGYRQNPFYIVDQSFIGGYVPGDVLCDANSTMPQSVWDYLSILFTSGAPRFRVNVTGPGQVELHLLRIAFGGIALVWQDDDYSTADVLDLQSFALADIAPGTLDLLSFIDNALDGDFSDVLIHERFFDTDGPHHIDVSFLPILDANITQLGWGGGLRKIVLCGFDSMPGDNMQLRQTDCKLEYSIDDGQTWLTAFDADPCKPVIQYIDGSIVVDGNTIVTGDTIINNTIIIDDTTDYAPDGLNKRCDLTSYLVDIPLPHIANNLLTEYANANGDSTLLLLGIIGITAVVATGGLALLGVPAIAIGGVGIIGGVSAGYTAVEGVLNQIDINATTAEMTAQFWQQDLKCVIYCNLGNDGILNDETCLRISDAITAELATAYPNASQLLSVIFRTMSAESRDKYNMFGALYDGSNCDLCACGYWQHEITNWNFQTKYFVPESNCAVLPNKSSIDDLDRDYRNNYMKFILDISKTPGMFWALDASSLSIKDPNDTGSSYAIVDRWDDTAQAWVNIWSRSTSIGTGTNFFENMRDSLTTGRITFPPTTKIRIEYRSWGDNDNNSNYNNSLSTLIVYGQAIDPFQIELDENA